MDLPLQVGLQRSRPYVFKKRVLQLTAPTPPSMGGAKHHTSQSHSNILQKKNEIIMVSL